LKWDGTLNEVEKDYIPFEFSELFVGLY